MARTAYWALVEIRMSGALAAAGRFGRLLRSRLVVFLKPGSQILDFLFQRPDTPIYGGREVVTATEAEMAKYASNVFGALKVVYANILADMTGNAVLAKTMRELATRTCLVIALYDKPAVPSCLSDDHAELVDAIAAGERAHATRLMLEHLRHVEQNLDLTDTATATLDLEAVLT